MESLDFNEIVHLIIIIEYLLLILFLLYNLKANFNSAKPLNYLGLFHYFGIILCILKIAVYIFLILDVSNKTQQFLRILIFLVYYTVFTIISASW